MVAGGMESMSNAPYYMKRGQTPYGKVELLVGIGFTGSSYANTQGGIFFNVYMH